MSDLPATRLLPPAEVERHYGFTPVRLQEWRARGGGPLWRKIGRSVFYRIDDLEAFVAAAAAVSSRSHRGGCDRDHGLAIITQLGRSWGDGTPAGGRLWDAHEYFERVLAPHATALAAALADPRPGGGVPDKSVVRIGADGRLGFTVSHASYGDVDVVYDPQRRQASSTEGAPWTPGLLGLIGHVFWLREGKPRTKQLGALERLLVLTGLNALGLAAPTGGASKEGLDA